MLFSSMRVRLSPRPIAHYVVGLFLVLVTALAVLAAFVSHDTSLLKEQIAQSDSNLARQEMGEAIALLIQQADKTAQALGQWDEARQQLENPVYYGYWRNSRALSAGVIPETLDGVELYDLEGRNLSTVTTGDAVIDRKSVV